VAIQDARSFLLEFKRAATGGSGIDIVPRTETRTTLARLGLTLANLEEILLGLSVIDYCRGRSRIVIDQATFGFLDAKLKNTRFTSS